MEPDATSAVIYGAKSTEDVHGSIPTQLEDCRKMAEHEGWEIVGEFTDEGFSAYSGNRGKGLEDAKVKATAVANQHGEALPGYDDHDDLRVIEEAARRFAEASGYIRAIDILRRWENAKDDARRRGPLEEVA